MRCTGVLILRCFWDGLSGMRLGLPRYHATAATTLPLATPCRYKTGRMQGGMDTKVMSASNDGSWGAK
eukprot:scaffold115029_cov31-Tisochrysis_lutea.AAC.5